MQLLEESSGTVRAFVTHPLEWEHDWDPELPSCVQLFRQDEVVVTFPRERLQDIDPDTSTALIHTSRGVTGKDPALFLTEEFAFIRFPLPKDLELGNPVRSLTRNIYLNLKGVNIPYLLVFGGAK